MTPLDLGKLLEMKNELAKRVLRVILEDNCKHCDAVVMAAITLAGM